MHLHDGKAIKWHQAHWSTCRTTETSEQHHLSCVTLITLYFANEIYQIVFFFRSPLVRLECDAEVERFAIG